VCRVLLTFVLISLFGVFTKESKQRNCKCHLQIRCQLIDLKNSGFKLGLNPKVIWCCVNYLLTYLFWGLVLACFKTLVHIETLGKRWSHPTSMYVVCCGFELQNVIKSVNSLKEWE